MKKVNYTAELERALVSLMAAQGGDIVFLSKRFGKKVERPENKEAWRKAYDVLDRLSAARKRARGES